jgi:hypothetical protein
LPEGIPVTAALVSPLVRCLLWQSGRGGCRGRGLFYEVDRDALALLRAMKEHHDHHNPDTPLSEGTRLAPELVAASVGMEPGAMRYERAVRYLVREGAVVWDERLGGVPGVDFYRITARGLEMLGTP